MSKTLQLYEKIQKYNGPKLVFIISGGGIGVTDLVKVMGASKIVHAIQIPYDSDEAVRFVTQNIRLPLPSGMEPIELENIKFVSEDWAKHLCNAGLTEYAGSKCKVFAITAGITTNRYRKGENHAWIACGTTADNIETHHLQLPKLSEEDHDKMFPGYVDWKRGSDDRQIADFVLDLVFENKASTIIKATTTLETLETAYNSLMKNPEAAFVCRADGKILSFGEYIKSKKTSNQNRPSKMILVPGTFNPLHQAHEEIYHSALMEIANGLAEHMSNGNVGFIPETFPVSSVAYEVSIDRRGKESLSFTDLKEKLKQFEGIADVVITRAPLFVEKINVLSKHVTAIEFHIGIDTMTRMFSDYSAAGFEALNAKFIVYDRIMNDKLCTMKTEFEDKNLIAPANCISSTLNEKRTKESLELSSTAIRAIKAAQTSKQYYSFADLNGLNRNPNF